MRLLFSSESSDLTIWFLVPVWVDSFSKKEIHQLARLFPSYAIFSQ